MPTSAVWDEGPRIELPVSLPRPTAARFAATAAAVPPLDPAGTRSSAYGLRVCPCSERSRTTCRERSRTIVRVDPLQILIDERAAGELLRAHRGVDLGNRGFFELKRCRSPLSTRGPYQEEDDGSGGGTRDQSATEE